MDVTERIPVYEVLGEDSNKKPATLGEIRFDIRVDNKVILSIDNQHGETLASAILTINQMNDLVSISNDILLLQIRRVKK